MRLLWEDRAWWLRISIKHKYFITHIHKIFCHIFTYFRREIEAYTREITSELLSCDKLFSRRDSGCKCPKCGTGNMQFYGKVVRCDNAECGLPVFRLKANRTLSDDEIKELLTDGHTKLLKGFKSKQGKSFDAIEIGRASCRERV